MNMNIFDWIKSKRKSKNFIASINKENVISDEEINQRIWNSFP